MAGGDVGDFDGGADLGREDEAVGDAAVDAVGGIRWRAPLWVAQVDPKTLRLIRATELVVLPLLDDGVNAADLVAFNGNFGICNASPAESWITDGSWCPKTNTGELNLSS